MNTDNDDDFCTTCFTRKIGDEFCPCCEAIGLTVGKTEIPFSKYIISNGIKSNHFSALNKISFHSEHGDIMSSVYLGNSYIELCFDNKKKKYLLLSW